MRPPRLFQLNNGLTIPSVGVGCWLGGADLNGRTEQMLKTALEVGYRHIDTATGYTNEAAVGKALRESHIPRSEIFLTTKLANADHDRVAEALEESLTALGVGYIDLYLIHWPQAAIAPPGVIGLTNAAASKYVIQPEVSPTIPETWAAMEALLGTGKVKSIGVSNFGEHLLDVLLEKAKVVPAVNQIQAHPAWPRQPLVDYCKAKGIHVTAYTPLGQSKSPFFADEDCLRVAEKYGATVAQVVLSWNVQRGVSVIPKSENRERLQSNLELLELAKEDFDVIENLHKKPGMHRQMIDSPVYDFQNNRILGWTMQQLGWNLDHRGHVPE